MRIKEIDITGFGKLANKRFKFGESLNLIKGLNEAGKTTLISAILGALYGFKGRSEEMRSLKKRYQPWDNTIPYRVKLTVNFGDPFDYVIDRAFDDNILNLWKLEDGQKLPTSSSLEVLLSQKLGLPSGRLFQSTLLIKQEEVADLYKSELSDAISKKLTESESGLSVNEINQLLSNRLKELKRGIDRKSANPGPIKSYKDEINKLKEELQELSDYHREYKEILSKSKQKKVEAERLEKKIEELSLNIIDYETTHQYIRELEQVENRIRELKIIKEKITATEQELEVIGRRLKHFSKVSNCLNNDKMKELESFERKLKITEQKLEQLNYEYRKAENKRSLVQQEIGNLTKTMATCYSMRYNEKSLAEARRLKAVIDSLTVELIQKEERMTELNINKSVRFTWAFPLGLILCLTPVIDLFIRNSYAYFTTGILFAVGILVLYFNGMNPKVRVSTELVKITADDIHRIRTGLESYQKMLDNILVNEDIDSFASKVNEHNQLKHKIQNLEEGFKNFNLESIENEIKKAGNDLNKYLKEIRTILNQADACSIEEFRENIEEVRELKSQQKAVHDAIKFLTHEINYHDINEELDTLHQKARKLKSKLLNSKEITQQDFESIQAELAELKHVYKITKEDEIKTAAAVENYKHLVLRERDIWSLEMDLVEKEEKLNELELECKGVELAAKLINEASEEAKSKLAPQVKNRLEKIFSKITRNRYREVRLEMEANKLVFQFMDEKFGQFRDTHFLSSGTRDQLYLALRIALGEYLTKTTGSPIILDDPFVNFDNERLANTVELLHLISREHQVIWLTKDFDWADRISDMVILELS